MIRTVSFGCERKTLWAKGRRVLLKMRIHVFNCVRVQDTLRVAGCAPPAGGGSFCAGLL